MPSSDTYFKPGVSGNPGGKAEGTKNKGHLLATYWLEKAETEWVELQPYQRASIACKIACALLGRQMAHATPEQSVQNAEASMKLLKILQEASLNGNNLGNGSGGHPSGVEDRRFAPQASTSSTPSL